MLNKLTRWKAVVESGGKTLAESVFWADQDNAMAFHDVFRCCVFPPLFNFNILQDFDEPATVEAKP